MSNPKMDRVLRKPVYIKQEIGEKPRVPARPFIGITPEEAGKMSRKLAEKVTKRLIERLKQKVLFVNKGKDRTRGVHLLGRLEDIQGLFRDWGVQYVGQEIIERLPAINVVEETNDDRWPEGIIRVTNLETGRSRCIVRRLKYGPLGKEFSLKHEMEVARAI